MAPRIDEARVRQHQLNETDIEPGVQHFSMKNGAALYARNTGPFQIALTESAQLRGRQQRRRFEKCRLALPAVELVGQQPPGFRRIGLQHRYRSRLRARVARGSRAAP
jgi:hypothetical protein